MSQLALDIKNIVEEIIKFSRVSVYHTKLLQHYTEKNVPNALYRCDQDHLLVTLKRYKEYCITMSTLADATATNQWGDVPYLAYVYLIHTFDEYYRHSDDHSVYKSGEKHEQNIKECALAHPDYVTRLQKETLEVAVKDKVLTSVSDVMTVLHGIMPMKLWNVYELIPGNILDNVIELNAALEEFALSMRNVQSRAKHRFIHTKFTNNKTPVLALSVAQKALCVKILKHSQLAQKLPIEVRRNLYNIRIEQTDIPEGSSTIKKNTLTWNRAYDTSWKMVL